ncbi:hypothetical protein DLM76_20365 [Leptospira yasudae]|nr:hypothetical protein DLM76_20365 [Leptospira yasudae]
MTPPELTDEEIREVEKKLKRFFTPSEIHAIKNSTGLRNAVEFIKKRHKGTTISVYNLLGPSE